MGSLGTRLVRRWICRMSRAPASRPSRDGFHAPAEWEPHACCLIGWPWRSDIWPDGGKRARPAFLDVIREVCKFEKVVVIAKPGTFTNADFKELSSEIASEQVEVCPLLCDDAWLRDTGPTFLVSQDPTHKEVRGVAWRFNCWGSPSTTESYWREDAMVASRVCKRLGCNCYTPELVCEGGALAFDGEGTVITTESVLMDEKRNPGKTRYIIEETLLSNLRAKKIIWLPEGVHGDTDTKGHVDNLVAFVRPGEVVFNWTDDEGDPQYPVSSKAEAILAQETDAKGRKLRIHRLHQPDVMVVTEEEAATTDPGLHDEWGPGTRLPASYVNFYISNGSVVVPQFNQPERDEEALRVLKGLFPRRDVIGVQSRDILIGGGNIHCITQQVPL